MKNTYIVVAIVVVVAAAGLWWASRSDVVPAPQNNQDNNIVGEVSLQDGIYKIDTEKSGIQSDIGVAQIPTGSFSVMNGEVYDASFEITAMGEKATFAMTKLLPNPVQGTSTGKYIVDGMLTMNGATKPISFPITFSQTGDVIKADSAFAISGAEWGVRLVAYLDVHIEASK